MVCACLAFVGVYCVTLWLCCFLAFELCLMLGWVVFAVACFAFALYGVVLFVLMW